MKMLTRLLPLCLLTVLLASSCRVKEKCAAYSEVPLEVTSVIQEPVCAE